jgi:hypothetical protein
LHNTGSPSGERLIVRQLLFAVLVLVPTALVTWMLARGTGVCRVEGGPVRAPEAAPVEGDPDQALKAIFAAPVGAFTLKEEVPLYDQKGLFDYIDGAAPVFIERSFRKLAPAELKVTSADGEGEITADVYDMVAPENAASIYGFERPQAAEAAAFGDEGHKGRMSLVFRKGRYYVKLTAFNATAEAQLPELAKLITSRMP